MIEVNTQPLNSNHSYVLTKEAYIAGKTEEVYSS